MSEHMPSREELARRLQYTARLAGVGKVASGAAHEINQPLNVIRMAAFNLKRAIQKNKLEPEAALEKLARIDEQIARAARLAGGMKAFSPTASQLKTPVKPTEAISVALELLAKRFSAADAELAYSPAETDCEVQAVPTALQELLFNLVDNAVEAFQRLGPVTINPNADPDADQPEPRVIRVAETVADGQFELVVADNAGGMAVDQIESLQQAFVTSADDGTHPGLGLAICREVVDELGGSLSISSDDNGTTVTVRFPVDLAPGD